LKTLQKNQVKVDVLYSHFITPAGIATARIGKKLNKPVYIAHGEATMMTIDDFGGAKAVAKELEKISGVVAVSAHNKKMLVDNHVVSAEKIEIFPNGYNPKRFYKIDKIEARERMGFPQDNFIVGFVGSFDERKGILRVEQAVDQLGEVKFACAGRGGQVPTSSNCIFKEPVNNTELVYFYNACDMLALPTRMEGCCNAIVEAVACGLPVVSSDRLFNYDILDQSNSILIEPDDVDALSSAIKRLYENPELVKQLGKGSLNVSQKLTLDARANNIIRFMEKGLVL
jgi:glycosyltransferase involved in cell wall biosynthesis